ncbi:MAG: lyase family protein [Pseudomonadota bacterium]
MATSLFDAGPFARLLGDAPLQRLLSDSAEIRAMMLVEAALATAQADQGVIPQEAADAINRAAREAEIDPASLAEATGRDGVSVPGFVAAFRGQIGDPALAAHLHHGATSQDILDTALSLRLRQILGLLDLRIEALLATARNQARSHKTTLMAARTRGQVAMPTTLGAKIAQWAAPFLDHRGALTHMRPQIEVAHLHGAAGTSAALGPVGPVRARFASELGLHARDIAGHSDRAPIVALGHWLARVTSSCAKMGRDILLMSQSELQEVTAGPGGASSTMPHKSNPVLAEVLVALGHYARGQAACLAAAQDHAHERDGAAWMLEWMVLPGLLRASGAALLLSETALGSLRACPDAMAATLDALKGLTQAECATFALSAHMPRPEAQDLVKTACQDAVAAGTSLQEALSRLSPLPLDWAAILDPNAATGDASDQVEAFVARTAGMSGQPN